MGVFARVWVKGAAGECGHGALTTGLVGRREAGFPIPMRHTLGELPPPHSCTATLRQPHREGPGNAHPRLPSCYPARQLSPTWNRKGRGPLALSTQDHVLLQSRAEKGGGWVLRGQTDPPANATRAVGNTAVVPQKAKHRITR